MSNYSFWLRYTAFEPRNFSLNITSRLLSQILKILEMAGRNRIFYRWDFIENLWEFNPIWALKLTSFSLGSKINASY